MYPSTIPDERMTDIHMHLIPGVDDGAMDDTMALLMIRQAREEGIRKIFCTPHSSAFDRDPGEVCYRYECLKELAGQIFPDVQLYLGCEVMGDPYCMPEILSKLASGQYPGLNGTGCVLTEFSPWGTAREAEQCLAALIRAGWKPVIAHLERYPYLREEMTTVDRFRDMGCLIQVNAYSLAEEGDPAIRSWARRLVQEEKADFLGTDAHRTYHRPPRAKTGVDWIWEHCPGDYAAGLVSGNARELLEV